MTTTADYHDAIDDRQHQRRCPMSAAASKHSALPWHHNAELIVRACNAYPGLVSALEGILEELRTDYTDSDERLTSIRMIAEQELTKLARDGGAK